MKQRLILITAGFPYGSAETFLESEITYLAKGFKEIIILCPEPRDSRLRSLPNNCSVSFYTKELTQIDKLKALLGLFNKTTWKEIKIIRKTYQLKLSKGIISTLLISLYQAQRVAQLCQEKILKPSESKTNTIFYSYWCDDTALALALLKKDNPKIKCVSRAHGWDVYFGVHSINYLPFRHLINEDINAIYPISDKGKQEIEEVWKIQDTSKVKVSRLGVEKQEIAPLNKSQTFTLVSCSNMIPLKRVHLIAEAVMAYLEPIEWIHFGDGSEFESIQQYCEKKQQNFHSIAFRGRVPNAEVIDFYQKNWVDAFINTSSSEGVPVSIMEAMSFGIPCIATDVGGNSEIVNNENGILLTSDPSLNDIQKAIKSVLNNHSKSEAAYQTWKEKYNAEKNYKEFVEELILIMG